MYKKLDDLFKNLSSEKKKLVLAAAQDEHALEASYIAHKRGIIELMCTGDKAAILKIAEKKGIDLQGIDIIDETNGAKAVEHAIKLINAKKAHILMKGNVPTATLLKGVLNKEWGLRSGKLLSHFTIFEIGTYHKLLAVTDVAMNIAPDLSQKAGITANAVNYMNKIGVANPKVAIISAQEAVKEAMPSTIDAAILAKMAERKQITDCIIDGPLALDNAISRESAEHKGIVSKVAGDADLLIMPNIEAGNVFYKTLSFLTNSKLAAVILGATAPIVLTSRADSEQVKLNSIYLAALGA